jgi:threonine dehydrogenase-like Zn-dependent dehydrogenase
MPTFTVFKGSKEGVAKQATTTRPDELTGDNVLVKITASGLCGTGKPHMMTSFLRGHLN